MRDIYSKTYTFKDFTIRGFSRAAVQTFWQIDEFHLGFDLGTQPWDSMGTPNWFISHTHLDHLAMLPNYVARRRMMKMEPPRIFMPHECVKDVQHLLHSWVRLDHGQFPCELIGLHPGERVELSREIVVEALKTSHRIPSLGYMVYNRRKKLLPEYQTLSTNQIRDIRMSGTEVSSERFIPRLGYLGDSNSLGLDENPVFYESEVLIMELTFVESQHRSQKIHKYGHLHLDDFLERQERFHNELIITSHFTARSNSGKIRQTVEEAVPDMLGERLLLWL